MKKIINTPETFIPEMLEGIYTAHPDELMCVEGDLHCLVSKRKHAGKVGIATGGGSGHLPLFLGYVGEGMLDGCSIGDVFQSPSAEQMLAVTKAINQGAGVLYIYGNYNGDIFNFDMAAEMADMEEDIRVESVVAGEDVASAPHLPPLDAHALEGAHGCSAEQLETIRRVHEALTADLSSRITIDELSRRFLMNPSTMKEVFKTVYGQSIAAHIREHRMERAAELLRETDASMAEIAAAIGYESASKFSAEFRKAYGALPTEYRRAARAEKG